jgi:hypothetical protein
LETVRVALAGLPALLTDIVRAVIAAEPMLLAVETDGPELPDVIVVGAGGPAAGDLIGALLREGSRTRLVVVAADGSSAYVCAPSGEMSADTLVQALRGQP